MGPSPSDEELTERIAWVRADDRGGAGIRFVTLRVRLFVLGQKAQNATVWMEVDE